MADQDAKTLDNAFFYRYLWVKSGLVNDAKAVVYSLNQLSSATIYRPTIIGGADAPMLVRVDLRMLAYSEADLKRWLATWEALSHDPSFHLLFTPDTLVKLKVLPAGVMKVLDNGLIAVPSKPYTHTDGKTYKERWVPVASIPRDSILASWAVLETVLATTAPVVESDYFVNRALSSLKAERDNPNAKVYDAVFGGLYFEFVGVRTAKQAGKKKASDLDVLFQDLGIIDDADGPITAQQKIDALGSEQRVAIRKSKVTGKPRMVAIFPTLKAVRERGVVFVTHDPKDEDVGINDYPFANLLKFQGAAFEVIWVDANGTQKFALFNKAGALQTEVPFNIANDTTVPDPYTKRLHTISCITCHGIAGRDGWQPLPNDAAKLLPRLVKDSDYHKTVSKFTGNADFLLAELRRGSVGTALKITGRWENDEGGLAIVNLVSQQIDTVRRRYWYTEVDAALLLSELGYSPGKEDATVFLSKHLGVGPIEDSRVLQLTSGEAIQRAQAEFIKGFIAERIESFRKGNP